MGGRSLNIYTVKIFFSCANLNDSILRLKYEIFQTLTLPTWVQGLHQAHLCVLTQKTSLKEMQSKGIPLCWQSSSSLQPPAEVMTGLQDCPPCTHEQWPQGTRCWIHPVMTQAPLFPASRLTQFIKKHQVD